MATLEEQIQSIEDEIQKTPYNKATQHHIGKLKAKLARLKDEQETRRLKSGGGGPSYAVKKSGNATIGLVGFPSVGKSTLLNQITDATSAVAAYDFTTLTVIPGVMEYRGAKIQILDMPGLIRGASKGRGRGREVLSVARACDMILLMVDVFETNVQVLVRTVRREHPPEPATRGRRRFEGEPRRPDGEPHREAHLDRRGDNRGRLPGVGRPQRDRRRTGGRHRGPPHRRPRGETELHARARCPEQDRPRDPGVPENRGGPAEGLADPPD